MEEILRMEKKLVVVIMGPGKGHFAEMCLESVKDADKILYWTSSYGKVLEFCKNMDIYKNGKLEIFANNWDEKDLAINGKCRNLYLKYIQKNYNRWSCLVLDEDEILSEDGIKKIKKFIENENK